MKTKILKASMIVLITVMPYFVEAKEQSDSFDVLDSVMDNTKKEISAQSVLKVNKEEAEKFREKVISGWWEFMQANSNAKPGEYCAATFMRAKREKSTSGVDLFKDGVAVTLFGPGGDYRGALLGFSPISENNAFPKLSSGQRILVTLRQGNEPSSSLNAIYRTIGASALPMIVFAVPSIEALMAGMDDQWEFEVLYQDKSIAKVTWHSGIHAREELKKCLAGKPFDNKSHLKD